jgi:hypothetical protein
MAFLILFTYQQLQTPVSNFRLVVGFGGFALGNSAHTIFHTEAHVLRLNVNKLLRNLSNKTEHAKERQTKVANCQGSTCVK